MNAEKRNYLIIATLQTVVMFLMGIFGSKLSDLLNMSVPSLIFLTIILLVFCIVLNIRKEIKEVVSELRLRITILNIFRSILRRPLNIFIFSTIVGLLVSFISYRLFSTNHYLLFAFVSNDIFRISPDLTKIFFDSGALKDFKCWLWEYEIIAYFVFLILLYCINLITQNLSKILSFGVGCSVGVTTALLVFASESNQAPFTFISWILMMTIGGLIVSSKGISITVRSFISRVTRKFEDED